MGNFFTSSQIYNDKDLNKRQFIDKFCKAMADSGYVVCDSEESEMSYILRFAEKSKWVAIASELYGEGGQIAQADAGRIAKMLGTYCMNAEVIDSDCAAMSLYSNDGKEADMLLMGRYDDYFGDDIPEPKEKIWTQFLSDGSTWEQFIEILGGEYVFVEEGLVQIAPVISMDSDNLLFSTEYDADDEFVIFLDFRKTTSKNDRKFNLNNAFKQFIGTELEKKGFFKIKSRYPYYVRIVNNEILHVITYAEEKSIYKKFKSFNVFGGIATIYRAELDFSVSPKMNCNWLRNIFNVHRKLIFTDENYSYKNEEPELCFNCSIEPDKAADDMKCVFEHIDNVLIYAMNNIKDIDSFLKNFDLFDISMWIYEDEDFGKNYSGYSDNEGLLYIKNDSRQAIKDNHFKELECIKKQIALGKYPHISSYEEFQKNFEEGYMKQLSAFDKIRNSDKLYLKALNELQQRALKHKTKLLEYNIKL